MTCGLHQGVATPDFSSTGNVRAWKKEAVTFTCSLSHQNPGVGPCVWYVLDMNGNVTAEKVSYVWHVLDMNGNVLAEMVPVWLCTLLLAFSSRSFLLWYKLGTIFYGCAVCQIPVLGSCFLFFVYGLSLLTRTCDVLCKGLCWTATYKVCYVWLSTMKEYGFNVLGVVNVTCDVM